MSFSDSPSETKFREKARQFADRHIAPIAQKVEDGYFPREVLQRLGEERLLGAAFPKADGGLGLGWVFETIVAEEISAVSAATERSKPSTAGLSCFVVPRESRGLEVVKAYGLLGMHGANVVHLRFRNMRVSEDNVVGGINQGFPILLDELDRERPAVAAGML